MRVAISAPDDFVAPYLREALGEAFVRFEEELERRPVERRCTLGIGAAGRLPGVKVGRVEDAWRESFAAVRRVPCVQARAAHTARRERRQEGSMFASW